MSTETNSPQDRPNEFGFAGDGTAPEPQPTPEPGPEADGEAVAVPAGDLTGSATEAIEEFTDRDRE